jgi:hypothetical protein
MYARENSPIDSEHSDEQIDILFSYVILRTQERIILTGSQSINRR